jgi:dynein heavy chain
MWARAMHKYHFVAKGVAPKREKLRQASEELAETQRLLDGARNSLQEVTEGIATLQEKYEDVVRKKDDLENKCRCFKIDQSFFFINIEYICFTSQSIFLF